MAAPAIPVASQMRNRKRQWSLPSRNFCAMKPAMMIGAAISTKAATKAAVARGQSMSGSVALAWFLRYPVLIAILLKIVEPERLAHLGGEGVEHGFDLAPSRARRKVPDGFKSDGQLAHVILQLVIGFRVDLNLQGRNLAIARIG